MGKKFDRIKQSLKIMGAIVGAATITYMNTAKYHPQLTDQNRKVGDSEKMARIQMADNDAAMALYGNDPELLKYIKQMIQEIGKSMVTLESICDINKEDCAKLSNNVLKKISDARELVKNLEKLHDKAELMTQLLIIENDIKKILV